MMIALPRCRRHTVVSNSSAQGHYYLQQITHVPCSFGVISPVLHWLTPTRSCLLTHWRSNEGRLRSEKLRSAVVSGLGRAHAQVNDRPSGPWIERRRDSRHETDGGVRLAGGRAGEAIADDIDQNSVSDGSTLPPPYSSHFGES